MSAREAHVIAEAAGQLRGRRTSHAATPGLYGWYRPGIIFCAVARPESERAAFRKISSGLQSIALPAQGFFLPAEISRCFSRFSPKITCVSGSVRGSG